MLTFPHDYHRKVLHLALDESEADVAAGRRMRADGLVKQVRSDTVMSTKERNHEIQGQQGGDVNKNMEFYPERPIKKTFKVDSLDRVG